MHFLLARAGQHGDYISNPLIHEGLASIVAEESAPHIKGVPVAYPASTTFMSLMMQIAGTEPVLTASFTGDWNPVRYIFNSRLEVRSRGNGQLLNAFGIVSGFLAISGQNGGETEANGVNPTCAAVAHLYAHMEQHSEYRPMFGREGRIGSASLWRRTANVCSLSLDSNLGSDLLPSAASPATPIRVVAPRRRRD